MRVRTTRLRKILRELREFCPALVPVRVRRRPLRDCWGYTVPVWDDDQRLSHFNIVLDSKLSWEATVQVLLHEWAHAVAWVEGHETVCDHGIEWAIAFSRVYSEVVEP